MIVAGVVDLPQAAQSVGLLLVLFFTPIPRELSAIAVAGVLLCSRKMKSREILHMVDWHLITLFCALFVIIRGIETTGIPADIVAAMKTGGIHLQGLFILTGFSVVLSNLVSNVPAVTLLVRFFDPAAPYVLSVASTFAGNLVTIGSIANLIVIEQATQLGVDLSFRDHARVGVPATPFSLAVLWPHGS